jgi:UDP-glucose 4-epimerase
MNRFSRVLVTGGAGFIGSHLVDALMSKGYHVRVVDNMSSGRTENVHRWLNHPDFDLIHADLKNSSVAEESVRDIEVVFHLAANPDVRLGGCDPSIHFAENLQVTFNILEGMRKSALAKSVVFASSSTVYGEPSKFPTPEDYGPLLPISIYGASKLGCESLISSYCHTFDIGAIILRFANIVGLRTTHGVIVDFIEKLRRNPSELEVLGDGKQRKSYLHVKDLVSAIFKVMNNMDKSKLEVYNVGSNDQVDVVRIASIVCEEMGIIRPKLRFNRCLKDGRGWKGDVKTMWLSTRKLQAVGWEPTLNSENTIRQSCHELLEST